MKTFQPNSCERDAAFTLRELLVVITVLGLLAGIFVTTAGGAATRRIKVAQCAANLRQFGQTLQIFANENRGRLPDATGGNWVWDFPIPAANALLEYGMTQRSFYCPGTRPRFNDKLNYLNPGPNSLWNYSGGFSFRIIGYAAALNQSSLVLSNQNSTILPEPPKLNSVTSLPIPANSDRVLIADATISENRMGTAANPAPAGSFVTVAGGFAGAPHISPHLNGNLPAGGNIAFKDGHVDWRPFLEMRQRASSGVGFWW